MDLPDRERVGGSRRWAPGAAVGGDPVVHRGTGDDVIRAARRARHRRGRVQAARQRLPAGGRGSALGQDEGAAKPGSGHRRVDRWSGEPARHFGALLLGRPRRAGPRVVLRGQGRAPASPGRPGGAAGRARSALWCATSPFAEPLPERWRLTHWVRPTLVGEVQFSEWTAEGHSASRCGVVCGRTSRPEEVGVSPDRAMPTTVEGRAADARRIWTRSSIRLRASPRGR